MKPWKCELCGKAFLNKDSYKSHLRRHRGEKPFNCDVCKKAFTELWALKKHLRKEKSMVDPNSMVDHDSQVVVATVATRMSNRVDSGVDSVSGGNFDNLIDKLVISRFPCCTALTKNI